MSTRIEKCQGRLTVYFEDPFWVGVFERIENGKLSAAKVTFGAEPKDYEVQEFINRHYYHLQFSPAIKTDVKDIKKNPKRAQRDAKKQILDFASGDFYNRQTQDAEHLETIVLLSRAWGETTE